MMGAGEARSSCVRARGSRTHLRALAIGCPLLVCDPDGWLLCATPSARRVLSEAGVVLGDLPCELPTGLWEALATTPLGQSVEWRPGDQERCLGMTRHAYEGGESIVLMREISHAQQALSRRLQRQRLEAIGQLVASIAHDLRAPLSSIVFGVSVLSERCHELAVEQLREKLEQIRVAATRQQETIAGLLDFARVGPPVKATLSLRSTLSRVTSLLRPSLRDGGHRIEVSVEDDADTVLGNPMVIEQILVNLILNASESREGAVAVRIACERHAIQRVVCLHVRDDGPGIAPEARARIFDPFFTTKENGTGLGLVTAREAAIDLGGSLELHPSEEGAHFVVTLPLGRASRSTISETWR